MDIKSKDTVTAASLKGKLTVGKGYVENLVVKEQVIFKKLPPNTKNFHFKNVEFTKGVLFDDIGEIKVGIRFEDCSGTDISIWGCSVTTPTDAGFELPQGSGLVIENSQFKKVLVQNNPNFNRGIIIRNNSKIDALEITKSDFKLAGINIENSTINYQLDLLHIRSSGEFRFENSVIKGKIRILDVYTSSFVCLYSTCKKDIHFDNNSFNVSLNNSEFEDDLYFRQNSISSFSSYANNFQRKLEFNVQGDVKNIYIQNTEIGEGLEFRGNNNEIKKINIPSNDLLSGTIKFSNFKIIKADLSGLNRHANLIFSDIVFHNLQISDFNNSGGLTFANCKGTSESRLIITSSHLSNSIFLSFDFKSFSRIKIESSVLHDIEISNPILPKPSQLESDELAKKREIYRQLRHAVSKKGDSILTKELRAEELELFRKEKSNTSIFNRDRIILWLSSTNGMGLNWSKPIFILLGFTFFFHLFAVAAHSNILTFVNPLCISEVDWSKTFSVYLSYGAYFWSMFNPIRNLQSILGESAGALNGWVYFWDGLHRIILAFFIFQIVSAFRKYL
jgi:hypothetical protein